jgi:hypothetical protein
VGTPVVAIYRTGDPQGYGPRGLGHTVVGKGGAWQVFTEVSVDDVLDATDAAVAALA